MAKEIDSPIRKKPPCYGCNEKFITCHGNCPKDNRGEYGYGAWKAELDHVNAKRRKYNEKPFVKYNPFDY
jgi:hypothetical protein